MPIKSPVHDVLEPYCVSKRWKDWAGYYAVCSFEPCHEREYLALRHSAGLIDVTPLFKYDVRGKEAAAFLSYVMVKDIRKLKPGRVTYCGWCDEQGKLIDDGTISCLDENHYRVTAAEPSYAWFTQFSDHFDVHIEDTTEQWVALSLQGPLSREILKTLVEGFNVDELKFFATAEARLCGHIVRISRTGYTGDLGYEIWMPNEGSQDICQNIIEAGKPFGMRLCGLDALDMTRIEAGFIMNGVEYFSAHHCLADHQKTSPYELGLGWCVQLEREPFIGQRALKQEQQEGVARQLVGLVTNWDELEAAYQSFNLPPRLQGAAWRDGRPVYDSLGSFIGQATSGTWSPLLKQNIALALIQSEYAEPGSEVKLEVTIEYRRLSITATVVRLPFFNPERKRG